jgi:hypothetical protein
VGEGDLNAQSGCLHLTINKNYYELLASGLWIRIRIGSGFRDFLDPDPGARKLRNFSGKSTSVIKKKNLPLNSTNGTF